MNKRVVFLLVLVLTVLSSIVFASQDVIEVKLNDKYIDFTDSEGNRVDPELINNRTMVPMRKIFETLGATVEWEGETRSVTAKTDSKEIVLQIDNTEASLKDLSTGETKNFTLDAAPVIIEGRTMVPVRFIAESLEKQVGWDAYNRVVVIIDYDRLMKELNDSCSTFFEMVKEQTVEIDTFDVTMKFDGNLNYKDSENSKNSEKLTLKGTVDVKKSDSLAQVTLNANISGSGQVNDALKEAKLNKINFDVILDVENQLGYVSSNLLGTDKWVRTDADIDESQLNVNPVDVDFSELIKLNESYLTKDSYDQLRGIADVFKFLLGNDRITVSGKSAKTYTMKWDLEEILKSIDVLSNEQLEELLSLGKATVELTNTYKDGMNTKGKIVIDVDIQNKDSKERITFKLTGDTKYNSYNKDVKITIPKESQIAEADDIDTSSIFGGLFMDTPNDAKFANFCQEYDRIQTAVQLKYYELYQKYAINLKHGEIMPSSFDLYKEVATGVQDNKQRDTNEWVQITNFGSNADNITKSALEQDGWYLRTSDGKLAYKGFEREKGVYYYTPSIFGSIIVNSFTDDIIK